MSARKPKARASKNRKHGDRKHSDQSSARTPGSQNSVLRIIGGQWRSRKLTFTAVDGLRPTTDRVRETLFNWLAPIMPGAQCLDLFAGSGALGLEALSREAKSVTFVDLSTTAIQSLKNNLQQLKADNAQVFSADAIKWLQTTQPQSAYDVIFIDPPFRCNLVPACIEQLQAQPFLKAGSYIYIEIEKETPLPPLPDHWRLHREKEAGQVRYMLFINNEPK